MITFDAFGWYEAKFFHSYTLRARLYEMGQNIEQNFKNQMRNVHGYHFTLKYSRPTYATLKETSQYRYFIRTMGTALGGNGTLLPLNYNSKYYPDFMLFEDIYFDTTQFKFIKPLSMNQFRYLCVVTPALEKEVPWLQVFIDPFRWTVWATFLAVIEMLALFVYRFGYIRRGILTIHFEIYQTFINGLPDRRRTRLEEYVTGMFVLLCMILMAVYESTLVSSMSLKRFYPEVDTIEEVNNSKYPVVIVRRVTEQFNIHFKRMVFFGEHNQSNRDPSLNNITDYQHLVPCESVDFYLERNASKRMHLVAEYAGSKTNNFAIATFSPYGEILYHYWSTFLEADLFRYWQLTQFAPKYFDRIGGLTVKAFSLKDMNIAWFVILVGYLVSIVAYFGELTCSCMVRNFFCKFSRTTFNGKNDE